MVISNFRYIFLLITIVTLSSCANISSMVEKSQNSIDLKYTSKKVYNDADLYGDKIEESKKFARLGMVKLTKYFNHKNLVAIEVKFNDYFEQGISKYFFKNGQLYHVVKTRIFGPKEKEIKDFYFENKQLIKCNYAQKNLCDEEKKMILHDIEVYINYQ